MTNKLILITVMSITLVCAAMAQGGPEAGPMGPPMGGPMHMQGGGMGMRMGHGGPGMGGPEMMGKWWKNSVLVKKLGLSDAQVQQIEKTFQDHRDQLIDLRAALEKQEVALEPMVEADRPDEAQVTSQIDKVAQARANLEKAHAQMLLAIRRVLTVEQWKTLQSEGPMGGMHMRGPGGHMQMHGGEACRCESSMPAK